MGKKIPLGSGLQSFLYAVNCLGKDAYDERILSFMEDRGVRFEINHEVMRESGNRLIGFGLLKGIDRPHPVNSNLAPIVIYSLTPAGEKALLSGERDEEIQ